MIMVLLEYIDTHKMMIPGNSDDASTTTMYVQLMSIETWKKNVMLRLCVCV